MSIEIIDGVGRSNHVTSDQIGLSQFGLFTGETVILDIGEKLGYELISNNQVNIKDGIFIIQGKRGWIEPGTVEECTIETGNVGQFRNDLICIKYDKGASDRVETFSIEVVRGNPGATAIDPVVTKGNINGEALLHYEPIYRVKLDGINVIAVEMLVKNILSIEKIEKNIGDLKKLSTGKKTSLVEAINELSAENDDLAKSLGEKAPKAHKHAAADITDIDQASVKYAASAGAVAWGKVSGKPSTFPPSAHNQAWSTITNKPSSFPPASHAHDDRYYTEAEVNNLLNQRLQSSIVKKTSKVYNISGNYIDIAFSEIGCTANVNYFIAAQNANRAANNATVIGVTLLGQPPNKFRVYFDAEKVGNIQINFFAIQI